MDKHLASLEELLKERVVIGDGAMGTMLYQRGVFLNQCFDELNITRPDLVKKIHEDYIKAGVDFIETNTFGANECKLAKYGLADSVEKINLAAVKLAKECSAGSVLVAGSMGPLGKEVITYDPQTIKQAEKAFTRQAAALIEGGVDFLILETFSSSKELIIAIRSIRQISKLPIVAQLTINEHNETLYGEQIQQAIPKVSAEEGVIAVGLNCSEGPVQMLSSLELIKNFTDKPICVQPNAGLPREVENRTLYMCTPEYMAEYAKRFFEVGAKIIGGCCGTTPEHIKEMARAIRSLNRAEGFMVAVIKKEPAAETIAVSGEKISKTTFAEKSMLASKLARKQKVMSIELTPPRGVDLNAVLEKAKFCAQMGVDVINIPDGPRASSRLSPMVTAVKIQEIAKIETILHFCCRDRNLIGMQSDLLGASAIGLKNVLIITGDPPKLGEYPDSTGVFDLDSIALTRVAKNLNNGTDVAGNSFSPGAEFAIGVGANPVAENLEREIERFRQKVEAGAEFAITQPVFDKEVLLKFLDAIKDFKIPIIAGIWPFTSFKNAEFMANEVPGVVVPQELLKKMQQTRDKNEGQIAGIEIARKIMEDINEYVDGFAVSAPFGNVKIALAVLGKIDIGKI